MEEFEIGAKVLVLWGANRGNEGTVRGRSGARYSVEVEASGRVVTTTVRDKDLAPAGNWAALGRAKLDHFIARRERAELFVWWANHLGDAPKDAAALIELARASRAWVESQAASRSSRRDQWHARLAAAGATAEDKVAFERVWQALEAEANDALAPPRLEPEVREAAHRLMERAQRVERAGGEPSYDREREHIANTLDVSVRSGYGTFDEVRAQLVEQVRGEFRLEEAETIATEVTHFEALLERGWATQQQAQQGWPERTTNDRLDAAFETLNARGIVALQDAGYTMSDGWEDIAAARGDIRGAWGGVFFHRQDVERAVDGAGLMLAFGAFADGPAHEAESLRLAREVCEVLAQHEVATEWDGTLGKRISIPPFAWQKRRYD